MNVNPNKMYKKIEKEINNIKYRAFEKVSVKRNKNVDSRMIALQRKKSNIKTNAMSDDIDEKIEEVNNELVDALREQQRENFQKEVTKYKRIISSKGKSAAVFNLRDSVLGTKRASQEPVSLKDPDTGFEVFSPKKIKEVSLKYVVKLLTNKKPAEGYEAQYLEKERLHEQRMIETFDDDFDILSLEIFQKVLRNISGKPGNKYNYIIKAGKSFINALFHFYSSVWRSEIIPLEWHKSYLVQLPKSSSNHVSDLDGMRHIHTKSEFV